MQHFETDIDVDVLPAPGADVPVTYLEKIMERELKPEMKRMKSAIILLLALVAALMTSTAWAHPGPGHGYGHGYYRHGGARVGLYVGGPVLGFPYYGYPGYGYGYGNGYGPYGYYAPATTVIMTPAAPPVYIEQSSTANNAGAIASGPASDGYWYYCSNPDGYYPYVRQCSTGWQKVPPQPASR